MKIALINDLSGFGNCSLTAAISITAALGHEPHPLPTAILSNQTAYDSYFMKDCTPYFEEYIKNWQLIGEKLDCIYLGFAPSPEMPDAATKLAKQHGALFVFDPVLGDNGEFYKCFDNGYLKGARRAAESADYITPNLTEACLLTGENYGAILQENSKDGFLSAVTAVSNKLLLLGTKNAVITGAVFGKKVYNVCNLEGKKYVYESDLQSVSYSGTGDVFASVFTGLILNGYAPETAVNIASDFVSDCISLSIKRNLPKEHGTDFSPLLCRLTALTKL